MFFLGGIATNNVQMGGQDTRNLSRCSEGGSRFSHSYLIRCGSVSDSSNGYVYNLQIRAL